MLAVLTIPVAVRGRTALPSDEVDVHEGTEHCGHCHTGGVEEPGPVKTPGNYGVLCDCHDALARMEHPTGLRPGPTLAERIPDDLPVPDGRMECVTCHDVTFQCRPDELDQPILRGGPYPDRTTFCFRCHDREAYLKFDPHNQLDEQGDVVTEKCLHCHERMPDPRWTSEENLAFVGGIAELCRRCHPLGMHPSGVDHEVAPTDALLERMAALERSLDIVLPLDEDGRLTCITCHNPHEVGVIPAHRPSSRGASERFRHRIPERLCASCHEK